MLIDLSNERLELSSCSISPGSLLKYCKKGGSTLRILHYNQVVRFVVIVVPEIGTGRGKDSEIRRDYSSFWDSIIINKSKTQAAVLVMTCLALNSMAVVNPIIEWAQSLC